MPSYEYSHKHGAFVKECSYCRNITIGTADNEESLKIFSEVFAPSNGSDSADRLQSRCWFCNNSKRRALGITRDFLEEQWLAQKGKCSICTKDISLKRNVGTDVHAHIDHDDVTGKVRELLCGNCNRGIGIFKHSPELLKAAATYLIKHNGTILPFKREDFG